MASVKKRGDTFLITVSMGYDHKKKVIKTITYKPEATTPKKAQKEAENFARKYEESLANGGIVASEKTTFQDVVDLWEKNWLPSKEKTVQEHYTDVLRCRVLPQIGRMKLSKIQASHIDNILNQEKEEGLAPKTVRMTFTVVNSVFRYAVKKKLVPENPCLRCDDLPPVTMKTGTDIQCFDLDQARRFLNDALKRKYSFDFKGHTRTLKSTGQQYDVPDYTETHDVGLQWEAYFNIAIYGGLRRGEMCALTWRDVDFEKHTVSVTKSRGMTRKDGDFVKDPKTKAGIRVVVLPSVCFSLLDQLRKEQIETALKMGTAWKGHRNTTYPDGSQDSFEDNTLFTQFDGSPVHLSTPYHKFTEIIDLYNSTCENEEDKLPKIRLHDLRHTSATLLISNGTDIETIAHRLGHSKASVTLDVYGHFLPENDQIASDALETMFANG